MLYFLIGYLEEHLVLTTVQLAQPYPIYHMTEPFVFQHGFGIVHIPGVDLKLVTVRLGYEHGSVRNIKLTPVLGDVPELVEPVLVFFLGEIDLYGSRSHLGIGCLLYTSDAADD